MPKQGVKVRWLFPNDTSEDSIVSNATDFLTSINQVDYITHEAQEYKILFTEIVVEKDPWIAVNLTYCDPLEPFEKLVTGGVVIGD